MEISAAQFDELISKNHDVKILDVRETLEFHTYNIGGINLPLSTLYNNIDNVGFNKTDKIIVICKAGIRSKTAQAILLQNGYTNVKNLSGGLLAMQRLPRVS